MTKEGWKEIILSCQKDPVQLELLSKLLEEQDRVRQLLIDKGYGYTGRSLLKTIEELKSVWR